MICDASYISDGQSKVEGGTHLALVGLVGSMILEEGLVGQRSHSPHFRLRVLQTRYHQYHPTNTQCVALTFALMTESNRRTYEYFFSTHHRIEPPWCSGSELGGTVTDTSMRKETFSLPFSLISIDELLTLTCVNGRKAAEREG